MRRKSYIAEHIDNEYRRRLKEEERKEKQNSINREWNNTLKKLGDDDNGE